MMKKLKTEEEAIKDLSDFMASLPEDRRLKMEQQQWLIDCRMIHIKNPLARASAAYNNMLESFYELNEKLKEIKQHD